ncbi:hypothetical protein GH714_024775 [Hevea brasiliensis]|uniref:Bulb-type lectin domain-containing protein n=1 Tax=Hevea brasiliensis TaxID=3981 RepID=A0A6A6MMP9_HEVBR|nr:hypothetical protein GH714_024775 [Hevea brasiliensis]
MMDHEGDAFNWRTQQQKPKVVGVPTSYSPKPSSVGIYLSSVQYYVNFLVCDTHKDEDDRCYFLGVLPAIAEEEKIPLIPVADGNAFVLSPDTITTTQSVRDGDYMVSAGGSYRLGFFSPDNSFNQYLGIWYNKVSVFTVVWVANRESPLRNSSSVLKITNEGILVLLNQNGSIIWSSNSTRSARNPVAQLLDSGNLIVKEEGDDNMENFLWQSFDYPCDTFLPGMKIGRNRVTGLDRFISSWKTPHDPSRGNFTYGLDPSGYPEIIVKEDSILRFGLDHGMVFVLPGHLN